MRFHGLTVLLLGCSLGLADDLTARFELTLNRVLKGGPPAYLPGFVLADAIPQHTRRFTEYCGDVSGRYIGALSVYSKASGARLSELENVVRKLLTLQRADGHFGDPLDSGKATTRNMAILWGNGRLLIGLLEYYQYNQRAEVLAAARKLGDFFAGMAPLYNSEEVQQQFSGDLLAVGYICWTQCLEGLVELARVTGENKYLDTARAVAARVDRFPAQHSHGFLTSLRGVLDLHRLSGDAKLLAQVETQWQALVESGNVLPHGAIPEAFAPKIKRDEGCSEADWLRLNLALWNTTRKQQYLQAAEWTLFNEFQFNQFRTGDFGHRDLSALGAGPASARAWWCCTLHGLRAFPEIAACVFHEENGTLFYDLPVNGYGRIGNDFVVHADSQLGTVGIINLDIQAAGKSSQTLAIRLPQWARNVGINLGGKKLDGILRNGYIHLTRTWKKNDRLLLAYDIRTRIMKKPGQTNLVAFTHGPWFLGVDNQGSPDFFGELTALNRVIAISTPSTGEVTLERVSSRQQSRTPFAVPMAEFNLRYLPGGYPAQPQQAVLRPIAEQTSLHDNTEWIFWFQTAPPGEELKTQRE